MVYLLVALLVYGSVPKGVSLTAFDLFLLFFSRISCSFLSISACKLSLCLVLGFDLSSTTSSAALFLGLMKPSRKGLLIEALGFAFIKALAAARALSFSA